MLVTVIGRGHSGTRAMSHTLSASGVCMGKPLNESGDLLPPQAMYEACRVLAPHVRWRGGLDWDFSALATARIPAEFTTLIRSYLRTVLRSRKPHRGWKIPETTLVFPWIQRLHPQAKYIFWIRDPRDCILGHHVTDDLQWLGVSAPQVEDDLLRRAISWKYQYDLVKAASRPANWIEVRFEDFVLRQDETLARLEQFLGIKLAKIPVRPETVGRWRTHPETRCFDFLAPALKAYGYELPPAKKLENTALC
ncbi:MAG: sulfotransferase family protein [Opitutales bacterium]